ncbi:MAG: element excision factor XisH family protein, partial [Thermodesulfobacteriota bacterium]|nr:element excision factor XisH family protein [Thermodesulfobacteriota bacterium]
MTRKDIYHDAVKQALQDDGWTITHDQFRLKL